MEERNREIAFWRHKFLLGLIFTLPVFLLAMVFEYIPVVKDGLETEVSGFTAGELTKLVLTTPVVVSLHA